MLYSALSAGDRDLREDEYALDALVLRMVGAVEHKLGPPGGTLALERG